jgi:NTE family protein
MTRRVGLALGGGAARGLAHIPMLEAFDELGIKPTIIAGSSMGAFVAAAYAAGHSGNDLRNHALRLLANRTAMARHLFGSKKLRPNSLFSLQSLRSLHLDGRALADAGLPDDVPANIEDCLIPLRLVATDYVDMRERVFSTGNLRTAVGASIAIPGVISGAVIDGHIHVDGGVTNPVPFDHVREKCDIVVAIDVTGRPKSIATRNPSNIELAIGSVLIMFHELAKLRRAASPPDIYITPEVDAFGAGDFFRAEEIFKSAEAAKDRLKRDLEASIGQL